jgi:quinol monooxygenase YgiN
MLPVRAAATSFTSIFRFTKENLDDVMAAFRALVSAMRQEPGNIAYDVYRGLDDDLEF